MYVGSVDHFLYALNSSGALLWTFHADNTVSSATVDANGTMLYVGCFDGHMFALHASNGTALWAAVVGQVNTSPSLASTGKWRCGCQRLCAPTPTLFYVRVLSMHECGVWACFP